MAKTIATLTGTALVPGVSRNDRLYTRELIGTAVARASSRIAAGQMPITMRSHHGAEDDSTRICGAVTRLWQDPQTGAAHYEAALADTEAGRTIAALTATSDGHPAFLRNVSIRGYWLGGVTPVEVDGREVITGSDLELDGLDFTASPGVPGAVIDNCVPVGESAAGARRMLVLESATSFLAPTAQPATITLTVEQLGRMLAAVRERAVANTAAAQAAARTAQAAELHASLHDATCAELAGRFDARLKGTSTGVDVLPAAWRERGIKTAWDYP